MSLPVSESNANSGNDFRQPEKRLTQPLHRIAEADPDLARLVAAWPGLPKPIKAAMLALVNAVPTCQGH